MINLDKLTILETHNAAEYRTEFKSWIRVHAEANVSDEVLPLAVRQDLAKAARDSIRRKIWEQIYGKDLRDQANRIRQEALLLREIPEKLRVEIGRLLDMLAYKP